MNSQKKYLQHVMFYCFKKDDSTNDTADEICTVYEWYYNYYDRPQLVSLEMRLGFCMKILKTSKIRTIKDNRSSIIMKPGFHPKKILLSMVGLEKCSLL